MTISQCGQMEACRTWRDLTELEPRKQRYEADPHLVPRGRVDRARWEAAKAACPHLAAHVARDDRPDCCPGLWGMHLDEDPVESRFIHDGLIAAWLVDLGWDDQAVVDLLHANRLRRGEPPSTPSIYRRQVETAHDMQTVAGWR